MAKYYLYVNDTYIGRSKSIEGIIANADSLHDFEYGDFAEIYYKSEVRVFKATNGEHIAIRKKGALPSCVRFGDDDWIMPWK